MSDYEFDDNIPIPEKKKGGARLRAKYHFMEPGQSYLVLPRDGESLSECQHRLSSSTYQAQKKTGFKFTSRVMHNEGGVRIWRIE